RPVILADGNEIDIADMRLHFSLIPDGATATNGARMPVAPTVVPAESASESCITPLHADELAILHEFMTSSAGVTEPRAVIQIALQTLLRHLRASVTGFMGLDQDNNPLPRVILPELSRV